MTLGRSCFRNSVLRAHVRELDRLRLRDAVRTRISPGVAEVMDNPGRAPEWIEARMLNEILAALYELRGRNTVREFGKAVMKTGYTTVLEPIIRMALSISGGDPGALYSRANLMVSVVARGIETRWTPSGAAAGTVQIRYQDLVPAPTWPSWEGCAVYVLELAGAQGTVSQARPAADDRSCDIEVSWKAA